MWRWTAPAPFTVALRRPTAPPSPTGPAFSDTADHWADREVRALKASGIFSGYEDGLFRPDNPVTLVELGAVLGCMVGLPRLLGAQVGSVSPIPIKTGWRRQPDLAFEDYELADAVPDDLRPALNRLASLGARGRRFRRTGGRKFRVK